MLLSTSVSMSNVGLSETGSISSASMSAVPLNASADSRPVDSQNPPSEIDLVSFSDSVSATSTMSTQSLQEVVVQVAVQQVVQQQIPAPILAANVDPCCSGFTKNRGAILFIVFEVFTLIGIALVATLSVMVPRITSNHTGT